ncbi:cell surface glycoprotein [Streptomyces sp. NBC_01255]|uniref:zinc finger domain-containing protein n=1 Tax=Streptomyces sp. NBC_01255 TaxID=2903798 RepID=UPI002E37A202|nr:cell surface glycoprotein [Streptomyces sp. NBC_01255]
MDRREIAALLAYADRLDPTRAPTTKEAAAERLTQWADLLADVASTAPHPEGRHWDASQAVRRHIATSPYPIKPSDVGGLWAAFRRDVLGRHMDPVPNVDPDDQAAYRAALAGHRHAIETGRAVATPRALLPGESGTREQRDQFAAERLAAFGTYMPRTVKDALAPLRPVRAERERLAREGKPDALDVPCTWCKAETGQPCRDMRLNPTTQATANRRRTTPHPSRLDAATARQHAQETAA